MFGGPEHPLNPSTGTPAMIFGWLRRAARGARSCPRATPASRALRLEALEDRALLSAGALDLTFGSGGKKVTPITWPNSSAAQSMVIDPQGRHVVAGYSTWGPVSYFTVARYSPTGALDRSFNGSGTQIIAVGDAGDS